MNKEKEKKEKKKYQIDISEFSDLQNAVMDYFLLLTEIVNIENLTIESITMNCDSNKILIEGEIENKEEDEPSSDEEESDYEWI